MNLFADYQKKIFKSLKYLEKKNKIKVPSFLKNLTIELPPKNQDGDISCNAAMLLSKSNNISSVELAKIIRNHLLLKFKEFKHISVDGPGFINIHFHSSFWNILRRNTETLGSKIPNKLAGY